MMYTRLFEKKNGRFFMTLGYLCIIRSRTRGKILTRRGLINNYYYLSLLQATCTILTRVNHARL